MKKILLSLFTLAVIGLTAKVQAQCSIVISNVNIQPVGVPVVISATQCKYTFNATFDMTSNNGFKYLFFHTWLASDYPSPSIFDCGNSNAQDPGTSAQLGTAIDQVGTSFLDIGFINIPTQADGSTVPLTFATTYPHDNSVVLIQPAEPHQSGLTATRQKIGSTSTYHFVITSITVIVNQPCGGPLAVRTDIWGTNSNGSDPKAQCYICGIFQSFNDPTITGFKNCDRPARKYTMGVQTGDPTVKTLTWRVYIDNGTNPGVLDDAGDDGIQQAGDDLMVLTGTQNPFNFANPYTSGAPATYPHSSDPLYADIPLIYYAKVSGGGNAITKFIPNQQGCIPLPVGFKSFTAVRNHSNVLLKWETSFEQNSNGFAIERNIRGTWEQVAFVPSQAPGGNSTDALAYLYVDLNDVKGISQYRIKQVDFDAKFKFSDIRAVRGEGQAGHTIVFPNPSLDGRVSIVFEDAAVTRDASLSDISGRILKQWKGITNNNIQIDNLTPGMYSLKIVVPETGEQSVHKIIVSKR